jgi:hypothetical protein
MLYFFLIKNIPNDQLLTRLLTVSNIQGVSGKTLWKFNRLSCAINVAKQFNFYIGRKNSYLAFQ